MRPARHGTFSVMLFLICSVGLFLQGCKTRQESFYPTLAEAVKAGEVERGWMPAYLPESARAIHLAFDSESLLTWCAFEFSSGDSNRLESGLTLLAAVPPIAKRVESPGAAWWPEFLTGDLDLDRITAQGEMLYLGSQPQNPERPGILIFVINWEKGAGFFYRVPNKE